MNITPLNSLIDITQRWLNRRKHFDRIVLLLVGWVIIYFFWYVLLWHPLNIQRAQLLQEIGGFKNQISIYNAGSKTIAREGEETVKIQKLNMQNKAQIKFGLASSADTDEIIKLILNTKHNIKFVNLKTGKDSTVNVNSTAEPNKSIAGSNLEIVFNSDYFNTMAYLTQLENLPWCLAWDSILYKVDHYPQATVTINIMIVSN
jgi:hypothetical protein